MSEHVWEESGVLYRVKKAGDVVWFLDSKLPQQGGDSWGSEGLIHGVACCEILRLAAENAGLRGLLAESATHLRGLAPDDCNCARCDLATRIQQTLKGGDGE